MHGKKILIIMLLAVLFCAGWGIVPVAASEQDVFGSEWMSGVYFTDPSFLSPNWTAPAVTSSFADPSFLSKDWTVPNLNAPSATGSSSSPDLALLYTDPSFFSSGWKVPTVSPLADPTFTSPNWTVPTITPFADQNFESANWSVPSISNADPLLQVYIYNPGSADPFTVPDQSQKNNLPSYDPFASSPGPGWTTGGYLF